MIRNVIFDYGQVLVRFDPDYMTSFYVPDREARAGVARVVFDRLYWDRLDAGTITDDEVIAAIRERLPETYREAGVDAFTHWYDHIPAVPGMEDLLRRVKHEYGARVYLLSNISRGFAERVEAGKYPIFSDIDGCVFSAVCGYTKPNGEIFAHLCDRFGLVPGECLFIDDNPKNITGAEAFGIRGYLFDGDAGKLDSFLQDLLRH